MSLELPIRTGARSCALALPIIFALFAPGCLVDLDDRCGDNQRYDSERGTCSCQAGYALVGNSCAACGESEVGSPDGCICADGFVRLTPDADCEPLAGLGQECASDADCGDERYPYCQLELGAETGYCTSSDCSSGEDCPTDFGCNTRATPSFCEMPPTGLGKACSESAQCEGYQAQYCETVVAHSCVVNDCAPDPNKCHGDWVCCDIALLSQSLCIPPGELEDGNCPAGGSLVPRGQ